MLERAFFHELWIVGLNKAISVVICHTLIILAGGRPFRKDTWWKELVRHSREIVSICSVSLRTGCF